MPETFPKDDFGVIVENNGKEIIDYLVNKGFDKNFYLGINVTNGSFYYIEKK